MKQIITISGDIGGGKSAVARCLEASLGYAVVGTGAIQREIAKQRGMTTLELNQLSISDPSVDEEIDSFVVNLGKTRDRLIVDSRLAWHFIPDAFKAFLTVEPLVGARRVFGDSRAEEANPTVEKTLDNNRQRQGLETARFKKLYGVDFRDFRNYDAVIDTSHSPPAAIAATLAGLYRDALRHKPFPRLWLNARRLAPTRDIAAAGFQAEVEALRPSLRGHGFDPGQPIVCISLGDSLYVLDGHKRALAAQREGMDLLPCALAAGGEAPPPAEPSWLAAWEAALAAPAAGTP